MLSLKPLMSIQYSGSAVLTVVAFEIEDITEDDKAESSTVLSSSEPETVTSQTLKLFITQYVYKSQEFSG
ncbi:hypothetical protein V1478_011642 [Vespula squamosa]|uniref:Uncharacterized protein n=1 Tax=Vespula squamosa TaxID=30214 RepID=A0ABD2AF26_VESSQ